MTLTGLAEDGSELKLSVPITFSHLPNVPNSPPAIHALAARKIIQDIEDGQHAIATSVPDDADLVARTVKASIVRLAKMYSISSSQTSFVAVDESGTQYDYRPLSNIPDNDLDPHGIPKRPMNAFMLFARRRRPQVGAENQSMRTGDVSKILSQEWRAMSPVGLFLAIPLFVSLSTGRQTMLFNRVQATQRDLQQQVPRLRLPPPPKQLSQTPGRRRRRGQPRHPSCTGCSE